MNFKSMYSIHIYYSYVSLKINCDRENNQVEIGGFIKHLMVKDMV